MSNEDKVKYQNWVIEANNQVEADLFPLAEEIPLEKDSKEFAFAQSAALNWVVYKKRDLAGSRNAAAAKKDYEDDIERVKNYLRKKPTTRTNPIHTKTSDSLDDYLIPYSQTQGVPPDILY